MKVKAVAYFPRGFDSVAHVASHKGSNFHKMKFLQILQTKCTLQNIIANVGYAMDII